MLFYAPSPPQKIDAKKQQFRQTCVEIARKRISVRSCWRPQRPSWRPNFLPPAFGVSSPPENEFIVNNHKHKDTEREIGKGRRDKEIKEEWRRDGEREKERRGVERDRKEKERKKKKDREREEEKNIKTRSILIPPTFDIDFCPFISTFLIWLKLNQMLFLSMNMAI